MRTPIPSTLHREHFLAVPEECVNFKAFHLIKIILQWKNFLWSYTES